MVPKCIAIVPDGNRRWAKMKQLASGEGHRQGRTNCAEIAKAAFELGVEHVVIWAASKSNLERRSAEEKSVIFSLFKDELKRRLYRKDGNKTVAFKLVGEWQQHAADKILEGLADKVGEITAKGAMHHLTVLLGYSGLAEVAAAARSTVETGEPITEEALRRHAWTAHLPDVDLIIRTGVVGDPHLSDLLLPFQSGNAQLYFGGMFWPSFTVDDLHEAFGQFAARERRFGA